MTPTLRSYFADYAAHHGTPGNRLCHMIGIPLIVLSVFILLSKVALFTVGGFVVTAGEALLLAATVYYLTLDAPLALMMAAASAVMLALGRPLPAWLGWSLFVFGWILQFVGHYVYEKRSPAFYRNLAHLLVGPLWILAKAMRRA